MLCLLQKLFGQFQWIDLQSRQIRVEVNSGKYHVVMHTLKPVI